MAPMATTISTDVTRTSRASVKQFQRRRLPGTRRRTHLARRRVVAADRGREVVLDGYFEGVRVPPSAAACLKTSLREEKEAVETLAAIRRNVLSCIADARRSGATYTAIATAISPRGRTVAESLVLRKRAASAIACRVHEARKRTRQHR